MTETTKLICSECQHENEAERIYCHSCGARLDRSAATSHKEPPKETRKRLKHLFDPQRAKLRLLFFRVSKAVLGACALAALVQIILPPDIPEPPKMVMLASQIRFDLEKAIERHQATPLQYTDEQVNAYLRSVLKTKQSSLNKPLLDFKRAVIGFREGDCAITIERSLFGYSLYSGGIYAVAVKEGKFVTADKGGSIGRLPIHPQLMQFIDVVFTDLWSALDPERKLVAKLGGIEFHDKNVVLAAPSS
jgi:hypothetical protein